MESVRYVALFVAFITQSEVIGFGVTDNPIYKVLPLSPFECRYRTCDL